jgi:hypothetical protein
MYVTTINPADLHAVPAYDGPANEAHTRLIAGEYPVSFEFTDGKDGSGTLIVTATASYLVPDYAYTEYWTDAYGNTYGTIPAATDVTPGADLMLIPGTSYTVVDIGSYHPEEISPVGTVEDATDIDDSMAVYGRVQSVEPVDGDRVNVTIVDHPCAPWTFSIPAAMPVYIGV